MELDMNLVINMALERVDEVFQKEVEHIVDLILQMKKNSLILLNHTKKLSNQNKKIIL